MKKITAVGVMLVAVLLACQSNTFENPSGFAAVVTSSAQVKLSWNTLGEGVTYALQRKTRTSDYAALANNLSVVQYDDNTVNGSTAYTYRLVAQKAGASSSGVEQTALTPCAVPSVQPAGNVTETAPINKDAAFKTISPDDIDEVEPNRILAKPDGLTEGSLVVSNCNEGLLRRITKVTTTTAPGARPQAFSKVYIETEDTSLENIITDGAANIDYGDLPITNANTTELAPGARVQDLTATLQIKDFKLPLSIGNVNFNGKVTSSLTPNFKLEFAGSKVKSFEASMNGSLTLDVTGQLTASAGVQIAKELTIWKGSYTRAFLVGGVPVVVVLEPQLLAGAQANITGSVNVTAGIAPTFSAAFGVKYDGSKPSGERWSSPATSPTYSLNPKFEYSSKVSGSASAYVRFIIGVKFYGVAGPNLEARPEIALNLTPSASTGATLTASVLGKAGVGAGFKVLGAGLNLEYNKQLFKPQTGFNCKFDNAQGKYVCVKI